MKSMSPKVLNLIYQAFDAHGEAVFSREDIARWPEGDFESTLREGLLVEAAPADEVVCPGCEEACLEDVEFVRGDKPEETRAYVICGQRDDIGRVQIPMEMLDRWAVDRQRATELRGKEKGNASTPATKRPRLSKPLLKDSATRDRMLDKLSKNPEYRKAYEIVYKYWDNPHDETMRTVNNDTKLSLTDPSRISHMKKRMVDWNEENKPQKPPEELVKMVEQILCGLASIYVKKQAIFHKQWKKLVGTSDEPGHVRSEVCASLVEFPGDRKKAHAAGQKWIDAWLHERRRTDHQHDSDGQMIDL